MPRAGRKGGFISKVRQIVRNPVYQHIVDYHQESCSIRILDPPRFQNEVMTTYFRHQNFHSFVRQLNLYGFKKVRDVQGPISFTHSQLIRTRTLSSIASLKPRRNALSNDRDSSDEISGGYRSSLQRHRRQNTRFPRQTSRERQSSSPARGELLSPPQMAAHQVPLRPPSGEGVERQVVGQDNRWLVVQPTMTSMPMGVSYPWVYMPHAYPAYSFPL